MNNDDDDENKFEEFNDDENLEKNNDEYDDSKKSGIKGRIILLIVVFLIAIGSGIYFGLTSDSDIFEKIQSFSLKGNNASKLTASSSSEEKNTRKQSSTKKNAETPKSDDESTVNNESGATKKEESVQIMTFESDSRSKFVECGNGFYYFTKDGAKFYQSADTQKWNDTYTLSNITTVSNGDYSAVYEMLGRNLRVYSQNGTAYTVQADGLITHCELNPSGYSTIILNCDDEYKVQVYSSDGTMLLERFDQDKGVYPVSSALSDDGKVLAVTYVDTSDVSLISRVMLFYTSKDDSRQTDTGDFFAAVEKDDCVIPLIKFNSKGYFMALSDKTVFAVDMSGKEVWSVDLTNKAEKAAVLKNGDIAVALADQLAGKDGYPYGTLLIIGSGGKVVSEYKTGQSITYLNATDNGIVVGNNKNFACLSEKGKVLWNYDATQDISCVIPFDSIGRRVLMVTSTDAEIKNLK